MEKIVFESEKDGPAEFYVLEQTKIGGASYLLVTEEEDGDCDAFILKRLSQDEEEDAVYEMVESEEELADISRIFSEMLEDVDITM